jgi:thioredoxin 2
MGTWTTDDEGLLTRCVECARKIRVPYAHVGTRGRCGGCGAALAPPSEGVDVRSEAHFDRLATAAPRPVLVDFWAGWCGPCLMQAPEIEKVAALQAGRIVVAKVDVDRLPQVAQRFRIHSVPTLLLFVDGRETLRSPGARPAEGVLLAIADTLAEVQGPLGR